MAQSMKARLIRIMNHTARAYKSEMEASMSITAIGCMAPSRAMAWSAIV